MAMWSDSVALRRKQFIALVRKRVRPGSGSAREFLLSRTWGAPAAALRDLQTPFAIVGAVASWLYMPRRRTTEALAILVVAEDAPRLYDELARARCTRLIPLSFGGWTWRLPDGSTLDVLESSEPWARSAVNTPNRSPTGEPVIRLPYLVLLKLQASRTQDLADISRMLGAADEPALDEVRAVVRDQLGEENLEDLESLIALGRLEFETGSPDRGPRGSGEGQEDA
jgi:hypothetical protein